MNMIRVERIPQNIYTNHTHTQKEEGRKDGYRARRKAEPKAHS